MQDHAAALRNIV